MSNPQNPSTSTDKYYFYDDATKIVYYSDIFLEDRNDLIFVGQSDNPNIKMAVAAFMQHNKVNSGFKIREYKNN